MTYNNAKTENNHDLQIEISGKECDLPSNT